MRSIGASWGGKGEGRYLPTPRIKKKSKLKEEEKFQRLITKIIIII
jgi:hypothetical protein